MATPAIQVPLLASVHLMQQGTSPSADTLFGYTRNGCEIEEVPFSIDVPGDEHGGDSGPAVDIQELPSLWLIRLSLTKVVKSIWEQLESNRKGGTGGTYAAANIGKPYIAASTYYRVLISTADATWVRNFPICIPNREPKSYNLGTRYAEFSCGFLAMRDISSGVVWNQSTS